ncbi:MAG: T9SS type A sorting domain-containing protein [Bacteroidales bacterium]
MKRILTSSLLLLSVSLGVSAKIIYVTPEGNASANGTSWNTAVDKLSTAYSIAQKGDDIYMAAGKYIEMATVNMKEEVDVYGGFAKGQTSIDERIRPDASKPWFFTNETVVTGNGDFRLIDRADKETLWKQVIIDGISFKDFETSNGRVLYFRNSVLLQNSQVINCSCSNTIVYGEENFQIKDCYFAENGSFPLEKKAIAVQLRGYLQDCQSNSIENCLFENNDCQSFSIYNTATAGNPITTGGTYVEKCTFRGNKSTCISVSNQWEGRELKIQNCLFENNSSATTGTVFEGSSLAYFDFTHNIIRNNTNTTPVDGAWRNSILSVRSNGQFANNLIVNNTATQLLMDLQGSFVFNNTIANNIGTVYVGENYATLANSIVSGNTPGHKNKQVLAVENALVDHCLSDEEIVGESGSTVDNNLIEATTFVNPTTFKGATNEVDKIAQIQKADFSLLDASAAVNAGNMAFEEDYYMEAAWVASVMAKDVEGNDRITNGQINMGAYQGASNASGITENKADYGFVAVGNNQSIRVETAVSGTVYVYDLTGSCFSKNMISAGESISISVEKGIYLVSLNNKVTLKVLVK